MMEGLIRSNSEAASRRARDQRDLEACGEPVDPVSTDIPQYRHRVEIRAFEIARIQVSSATDDDDVGAMLWAAEVGYEEYSRAVSQRYMRAWKPVVGGYYVQRLDDGKVTEQYAQADVFRVAFARIS